MCADKNLKPTTTEQKVCNIKEYASLEVLGIKNIVLML